MFFSNQDPTSKSGTLKEASATLQTALEEAFNKSMDKMRQELAEAGFSGQEQEEFLRELRKTVQSEIINQFNQRIKEAANKQVTNK